jgi:hypothetical protein
VIELGGQILPDPFNMDASDHGKDLCHQRGIDTSTLGLEITEKAFAVGCI